MDTEDVLCTVGDAMQIRGGGSLCYKCNTSNTFCCPGSERPNKHRNQISEQEGDSEPSDNLQFLDRSAFSTYQKAKHGGEVKSFRVREGGYGDSQAASESGRRRGGSHQIVVVAVVKKEWNSHHNRGQSCRDWCRASLPIPTILLTFNSRHLAPSVD
ncbi:hypothetical protein B0H14DRAFT_2743989 [Mycena olivaceomarginata]|nr:hypothetical protein B0H14DRAFT_2743989 [Mycena olivaceomarginata]